MTAALAGLGSGALHALAGPDHLLGVAPHAVGLRRGAWRLGLAWGLGHAAGTVAALLLAAVGGFSVGGTAAMVALATALSRAGRRPRLAAVLPRLAPAASAASIAVGLVWVAAA
jgi:hypothetical protein